MKCEWGKTIGCGELPYPKENQCREKGDNTFTDENGDFNGHDFHLCDGHYIDAKNGRPNVSRTPEGEESLSNPQSAADILYFLRKKRNATQRR